MVSINKSSSICVGKSLYEDKETISETMREFELYSRNTHRWFASVSGIVKNYLGFQVFYFFFVWVLLKICFIFEHRRFILIVKLVFWFIIWKLFDQKNLVYILETMIKIFSKPNSNRDRIFYFLVWCNFMAILIATY